MTTASRREFDFLEYAGFVLLALQVAIFGKLWTDLGFDRATDNFPMVFMATALLVASQRKFVARPPNRGAAGWILASRAATLFLLALASVAIGVNRLVPEARPAPALITQSLFGLMFAIIALKGAGIGKLKPGSAMGLCVSWTMQSRLAWDRAHRSLGRVLFWGGLFGLVTALLIPPFASIALWFATVALAVTAALIESWQAWRIDPDRRRPA